MATPVTYLLGGAPDAYFNIRFRQRNTKGPRLIWTMPRCKLNQKKSIDLIADKYSSLPFDVKVLSYLDEATGLSIFGTVFHPDSEIVSPVTTMYSMPLGVMELFRTDLLETDYRHGGNVSDIKLKFDYKSVEHKQFMEGTVSVDDETTTEAAMSLDAMMDEWTAANIRDVTYSLLAA